MTFWLRRLFLRDHRVGRDAAKRRESLSPTVGRYFLLVSFVMLGLGVHRRINLLMLLADALLVMAVLNIVAARRSVGGLRGRRRIGEWLFARTPCAVEVQVSNPSGRARSQLRIEDGGLEREAEWTVDRLPGNGKTSWRRQVTPPRRGRYLWAALRASSSYPFGLFERRLELIPQESVVVLPHLGWLHRGRFLRRLRELTAQPQPTAVRRSPRPHPAALTEFHGLRSYQSGDSPRLIHWRTSARRGELMVREFEDVPNDNLLLVVDPALPSHSDDCDVPLREQFEEVVGLAATICWEWCRQRGDRLTLAVATTEGTIVDGSTGPAQARRTLECLAVLECCPGPAHPAVLTGLGEQRSSPALVVLLALGPSALADPLRHALGRRIHCLDATRMDRFDFYKPSP